MIECRLLCKDFEDEERFGAIGSDPDAGAEWQPFSFDIQRLESFKIAGTDPDDIICGIPSPKCTTIYMRSGAIFTIDLPFSKLKEHVRSKRDTVPND
jgi:hypothetical protein